MQHEQVVEGERPALASCFLHVGGKHSIGRTATQPCIDPRVCRSAVVRRSVTRCELADVDPIDAAASSFDEPGTLEDVGEQRVPRPWWCDEKV
jgi:hypothetical protein